MTMMTTSVTEGMYPNPFPPTWAEIWGEDDYGLYADLVYKKITQRFRWIAPGDFLMGSPATEPERFDGEQQHKVILTQGYWLADTAVTQALWQFVTGKNPAHFDNDPQNPVEKVSWQDCQTFIRQLNQQLSGQLDGLVCRLPTESEWEHACRAGTATPFSFGETITAEQVNFNGEVPYHKGEKSGKRGKTIPVKSLPPNQWGLYAMHGNVWEWCADAWQGQWGTETMTDPYHSGDDNADRVQRGGSWILYGRSVRSASRSHDSPGHRYDRIGLRVALGHELKARSAKPEAKG